MQCPKCKHENKADRKFCSKCGTPLENICPKCEFKNDPDDEFCGKCGIKLTENTTSITVSIPKLEDMHSQLQSLIPDILAQKYLSAEQQITAGENRPITALFADISGFTPLSATKSSETIFHLVQNCFKQLVSIVAKYEGSISGFRGDGLLALFGAPILHENDAERAILAAIDMREAIKDHQLQVSIGINTAMMTVGEIQTQLHNEYTAYGNDINLAKRLQESAKPGQILVGAGSHRLTRRAFDFDIISDLTMKGFIQSVTAYSVQQVKVHPEKLRGIEGLRARMIGREHEFTEVKDSVDEWLSGQGQIVSIIGEAGIGKSRLVSELKSYLVNKHAPGPLSRGEFETIPLLRGDKGVCDNLVLEGRCVSIGQPISYWPFLDILRTYFNLSEVDDTATIANKVMDGTARIFPRNTDETLPFLGNLLSIRFGNELDDKLKFATPEQIKHQTLMQLRDLFRTLAEKQPLLLILEDLHWADDFSLNLISLLMDELSHTPLMLLCIYRPDKEHQVSHLSDQAQRKCLDRYTELVLKKLSTVESRQLVEELLTIDNLPESVKNMILNKSEGNPFFIEEVIRSLIDRDLVYRAEERWKAREGLSNIDVPDTIQSVILARVDRLQTEAKYVLQCASVIGRLFKYNLLEHLSKQERNLNNYLIEFEEKDLVYPEHTIPELEYAFKHALTQEATYQSILEKKQKEFHLQIARGIEQLYYERLDEYYEELAQHYSKTDNAEKAVEYLLKAGEKAKKNYANETAISYFLEVLNTIDEKGIIRDDWKLEAQKGLGELYILIGKSVEAEKVFHEAIALGEKLKLSPRELVRLYAQVCEALHWQSRNDEAINYAKIGLELLGDNTECIETVLINYQIAASSAGKGNVKEWGEYIQKDIAIVDKSEYSPELRSVYNAIAFYYANNLNRDTEMAWNRYKKWEKLAIEHNDINSLANIYAGQGEFLEGKGDYINSIVLMQKALELYKRIGENKGLCYGPISIADKLLVLGDIELAESYYIQCVSFAEQIDMPIYASNAYLGLGDIMMCRRDWEKAISFYQKATTPAWDRPRFTKLMKAFIRIGRYDEAILQFGGDDKDHKNPLPEFQVLGNLWDSLPGLEEAYMLLNKSDEFLDLCRHLKERYANIIEMYSFHQWYLEKIQPSYSFLTISSDNDFQFGNINSLWNWVDEFSDCSYHLRDDSKGIEIHSANGRDINFNNNSAPRLLRQISKDFAVEVCMSPVSKDKPQIGGLIIWKDYGNYVCLVKGIKGQSEYGLHGYSNKKLIINGRGLLPTSENDETYLRLERSGDEFTSYCSVDGDNWFTCGKMILPLEDPIQVGIHAIGMIDRTIYCGEYKEGTATLFRNFKLWTKGQ